MKRSIIDLWVGVFVIIGILAIMFLSFRVANNNNIGNNTAKYYTLSAKFNNIGSLKEDAPIKVSGFTIGRVASIKLDPISYKALVKMHISKQYTFSNDSSAEILTTGLLGEQYIALQPGGDPDDLSDGGFITITSSALVLEQLIGKFMTNMSSK